MPIVSLIITPDKIRPNPSYQELLIEEHLENPRAEMSNQHLDNVIREVHKLARDGCARKEGDKHDCVTIGTLTFDDGESVHVTVIYGLDCIDDRQRFIEAIKNRMNKGRASSYPFVSPLDSSMC